MSVLRERITVVWLGLMVATCLTTWGLSQDLFSPAVAVTGIFLIAALKVRYVMLDFMELRHAPTGARAFFQSWIAVVVLVILGFWFATTSLT
ncbi:cytochrome C oxidase subunit IV family protein [[Mycobacterium] nativiensis]|uniref:Cytochrome C oxidase subunit IV family protein n=1 Tax=[Mycobacterium] nativiensis TaxID=2855503 RepID=A0ABU5XPX0_9MYCO|nr:cytochrome C oxidase subunit IV family protein [Mycolicibacter sp. MYC340]MEB3030024.1 cytochrome C oxidase subunit IV family protein [Mycolicibacter sp. MYC340]